MSTVIKSPNPARGARRPPFNFEDMGDRAEKYVATIREQAAEMLRKAQQEAEGIRQQAKREGFDAGMADAGRMVDERVAAQFQTLMPALQKAIEGIHDARTGLLRDWNTRCVQLAGAIAERVIRRELKQTPEITLTLVREALEMAAGSPQVRLQLNPDDRKGLGNRLEMLLAELGRLGPCEVVADDRVSQGGCVVETRFGRVDQQIESQIARIEAELS